MLNLFLQSYVFLVLKIFIINMYNSILGILKPRVNQALREEAFENNFTIILSFLAPSDHQSLKLTSRFFYYQFVGQEIWLSLKWGIAQEKTNYLDDLQFVEDEPKPVSKTEKSVRIHSLKKPKQINKKRQSSNIKEKGQAIASFNEITFRNTEIGFQRLLKTNKRKKVSELGPSLNEAQSLLQLPAEYSAQKYLIDSKDAWPVNMQRAYNLCCLVKKWNQFHHRFATKLKHHEKTWKELLKKLTELEEDCQIYTKKFGNDAYKEVLTVLYGASNSLLIDDQLNKVGKLFLQYHESFMKISQQINPMLTTLSDERKKIQSKQWSGDGTKYLQILGKNDESLDFILTVCESFPEISRFLCPSIVQLYGMIIDPNDYGELQIIQGEEITLQAVSWKHLCLKPEFYEFLFQLYISICGKIHKMINGFCREDLTINMLHTKIKNMKSCCQVLWNIAKYFAKIRKQLQSKDKKSKQQKQNIIEDFLKSYENRNEFLSFRKKSPAFLEKTLSQFKQRISLLKQNMQL